MDFRKIMKKIEINWNEEIRRLIQKEEAIRRDRCCALKLTESGKRSCS